MRETTFKDFFLQTHLDSCSHILAPTATAWLKQPHFDSRSKILAFVATYQILQPILTPVATSLHLQPHPNS